MKLRVFCLVAFASLFLIAELLPTEAAAQIAASVAQRDAQASTLVNAAVAALDVGKTVNDVTLQAAISYTAGSDEDAGSAARRLLVMGATSGADTLCGIRLGCRALEARAVTR